MTVVSQPRLVLVGRYRLDAPLGQSSDGWFCHAHDLVLDRPVMVKMFKSLVDEETARSFARQAKALAELRHAQLVPLHDGGIADGHPYVVLEPVDEFDLLDGTAERPLSAADTATLGAGLADALACMHAEGIVHGNLTPGSVLIDATGQRRLIGLGFGRAEDHTALADIHALGLVLLRCVSGPGADRLDGTIPGPLARVLTAMMCRDAAERPSAEACVRRLSRAADALATERRLPKVAMAQRDWVAGLAAVGGLATVAVIAFSPTSMPQESGPPMAATVPTMSSPAQVPLPNPTVTALPKQPVPSSPPTRRPPTTSMHPTRSARPTTNPPPSTVSTDPTTVAPTTTVPTTTADTPPGLAKKPFGLPPGLVKKLFWLDHDYWGWPFDW